MVVGAAYTGLSVTNRSISFRVTSSTVHRLHLIAVDTATAHADISMFILESIYTLEILHARRALIAVVVITRADGGVCGAG